MVMAMAATRIHRFRTRLIKCPNLAIDPTVFSTAAKEEEQDPREQLRRYFPATKGADFSSQSNRPGIRSGSSVSFTPIARRKYSMQDKSDHNHEEFPNLATSPTVFPAATEEEEQDVREQLRRYFPTTKGAIFNFQSNRPGIRSGSSVYFSPYSSTGMLQYGREHCVSRYQILGAFHTQAEVVATSASEEVDELADIDWDNLSFGIQKTDYMYLMKCHQDGEFCEGDIHPFGNIELSPSAGVLNYGQGLFEGLKAYRRDDGRIVLFRPEENALRMIMGAERMCMTAPSIEQFVEAVKQTVLANKRWIPPAGKGSLYIRPLLLGSGAILGLAPAPEITFLIYVSPVGNYFKEGLAPIQLQVETKYHRATPGGTGGVKAIGNYAPVLKIQRGAKEKGCSDVLYLDAIDNKYIEEVSSCNIFVVKDKIISTPALRGSILPGITRNSIIEVARSRGYEVHERLVHVDELMDADEVFCTGTAVVISAVGSITYLDRRFTYNNGTPGEVSQELYSALTGIQMGLAEDNMGWTMEVK